MSESGATQFTPHEQYIVSYFRDPASAKARFYTGYDWAFAIGSVLLMWKFYADDHAEPAFAYVACVLLFGRLHYYLVEGVRFAEVYRNIVVKYEARLAALEAQLKAKEPAKE
jgi:hypothetical protein